MTTDAHPRAGPVMVTPEFHHVVTSLRAVVQATCIPVGSLTPPPIYWQLVDHWNSRVAFNFGLAQLHLIGPMMLGAIMLRMDEPTYDELVRLLYAAQGVGAALPLLDYKVWRHVMREACAAVGRDATGEWPQPAGVVL